MRYELSNDLRFAILGSKEKSRIQVQTALSLPPRN